MTTTFLARPLRALAAPGTVWLLILGYIAVVFAIRVLVLPAASQDDAEQLIFAQTLAGGYNPSQPPLYTWLIWASTQIFGVTILAVALVKFACLGLVYVFLYLAGREVFRDADEDLILAALVGLSPLALYYVAFDALFNYSNTVLLAAACSATLFALLRLKRTGGLAAYAGFGLAVGVGLMSKYSYGVFVAALILAALATEAFRARLWDRRVVLSLAIAVAVCLPHLIWLAGGGADLAAAFQARLSGVGEGGYFARVGLGLVKLGNAVISFLFPLFIVWLVLFPRAWRRLPAVPPDLTDDKRCLEIFFAAALLIIAAGVLIFGITRVRNHYMFILLAAPLYAFIRIKASNASVLSRQLFTSFLVVATLVFVIGVPVRFNWAPQISSKAYFNLPYADLARQMRAAGFTGGTIVAGFPPIPDRRQHPAAIPRLARAEYQVSLLRAPGGARGRPMRAGLGRKQAAGPPGWAPVLCPERSRRRARRGRPRPLCRSRFPALPDTPVQAGLCARDRQNRNLPIIRVHNSVDNIYVNMTI